MTSTVGNFVFRGIVLLRWSSHETCLDLRLRILITMNSTSSRTTTTNINRTDTVIAMVITVLVGWFATVSISVLEFVVVAVERSVCIG